MLRDIYPVIIAAVLVLLIVAGKIYVMHENRVREARNEEPLTKERETIHVIDHSRR